MGACEQRRKSGWFRPRSLSALSSSSKVARAGSLEGCVPEELGWNFTLTASSRRPEFGEQAAMSLSWGEGEPAPFAVSSLRLPEARTADMAASDRCAGRAAGPAVVTGS